MNIVNLKDIKLTQKFVVFLYTHNENTDNLRKQLHSPLKQKE